MNNLTPKIRPTVPQSLKGNVLSQINKRKKIMKDIRNYSAFAAVIVAFIFVPIVLGNMTQTKAIQLIEDSINQSNEVKTMTIIYQMRNPFTYNPDVIEMNEKMNKVEGQIIYNQPQIWRFENENGWYISDGEKYYWHSNRYNNCIIRQEADTSDFGRLNALFLKPTILLNKVYEMVETKKADLDIVTKGNEICLTIKHKVRSIDKNRFMTGDLFGWYYNNIKGSFLTDCQQKYTFNKQSKLLLSFDISVRYGNEFVCILKSDIIKYNDQFQKDEIVKIPESLQKQYMRKGLFNMSSKQAVSNILADLKNDSTSNEKERFLYYGSKVSIDYKSYYQLEVIEIGETYKTTDYPGEIVPVIIKLENGIIKKLEIRLSKEYQKQPQFKKYWKWQLDDGL